MLFKHSDEFCSHILSRAVVVAQLVDRSLPIPEVRGLNQKFIFNIVNCQLHWEDKNKEKEAGNGPFKKTHSLWYLVSTDCVQ